MADSDENSNGVLIEGVGDSEESGFRTKIKNGSHHHQELGELTLYTVFSNLINAIFFRSPNSRYGSAHLLHRIKVSFSENIPLLRDASTNSGRHVLAWARRGSPLGLLLVISVGTILLTLTAATFNAVVVSLFMSLVVAGGFLALFFACVAAIYVGALSIAVCIISTATTVAIIAVLTATGWIGFFCTVWLVTKKSTSLVKHSLLMDQQFHLTFLIGMFHTTLN